MKITHIASHENDYWKEENNICDTQTAATLELTENTRQTITGFGGCFNELGWDALNLASKNQRDAFLDELFLKDNCNFTYGRVPIGANDFSKEWYSCCEIDGDFELKTFTIDRDKKYTLPFVKEAQKRCPNLTLFASPWSPPTWMKTHKAYNYGRIIMEDKILKTYANYFVKFVQAYAMEGVNVNQIHVQNEPMADQKFPSCLWKGEDMREFIRNYLGPAFRQAGLGTELWLGTINGPFTDYMVGKHYSLSEFYDQFANTILSDQETRKYITGVGVQWGGKHVLEEIEASYPDMRIMQTESECGDGQNTWIHMEYIFRQIWFYLKHGAEKYTYWNMALLKEGVSTWGWAQNSLCTVNPHTAELRLEPEFYLMKHFSHFVQNGAKVLETTGIFSSNSIAFINPDESIVVVVGNNMNQDRDFSCKYKATIFSSVIKAHSIHTFKID